MGTLMEPVPLYFDESGVYRVGHTRVPLDAVLDAFQEGAGPEEIVLRYDTLSLADVYQVIGYVLKHPDEVQAYMVMRRQQADSLLRQHPEWRPVGLRERLLARRNRP